MDALAEILHRNRVTGSISYRSVLGSPWSIAVPRVDSTGIFHFVMGGVCWLLPEEDGEPLRLVQGDVVLLPHGSPHVLTDRPGYPAASLDDVVADCELGPTAEFQFGGDGPKTCMLSGGYHVDADQAHPVFTHLPRVIHVPAAVDDSRAGIQAALRLLATELMEKRSGYQAVVDRLVDMVFVYIVRSWVEAQPEGLHGWLAALRHPRISEAICLLHREPEKRWTIGSLARAIGMSRSAFARDFKELTGEPPLTYLTRQRLDRAAQLLRCTDLSLAQIAERVGYDTEYSFSKAFKREKGIAPGRYRSAAA